MEDAFVNNMDGRSDVRSGGEKTKKILKNLQMCTKKKPKVEWLCSGVKLL
jgi:hypothetical protein